MDFSGREKQTRPESLQMCSQPKKPRQGATMASRRKSQERRRSRKPPARSKRECARCETDNSHRSPRSNQKLGTNPTLATLQGLSADADRELRARLSSGSKQLRQV